MPNNQDSLNKSISESFQAEKRFTKTVLRFMLLSFVVFLLGFFGVFYLSHQQASQREVLVAELLVQHESKNLNNRLESLLVLTQSIAQSPFLKQQLQQSNLGSQVLSPEAHSARIEELDAQWRASSEQNPFVQSYLNNPISSYLKQVKNQFIDGFGEIFVTNRYGEMLGTTGKLTTLAHFPKYWWQGAYHNGKPRVFIDDRGFDYSVKDFVVGIVVPVFEQGNFQGLLKANFRLNLLNSTLLSDLPNLTQQNFRLVRSTGEIIPKLPQDSVIKQTVPEFIVKEERQLIDQETLRGQVIETEKGKKVMAVAPIALTWVQNDEIYFGGKKGGIDQYRGHESKGWYLIFDSTPKSVLSWGAKLLQLKWLQTLALFGSMYVLLLVLVYRCFLSPKRRMHQQLNQFMASFPLPIEFHEHLNRQKFVENLPSQSSAKTPPNFNDDFDELIHRASIYQESLKRCQQDLSQCQKQLKLLEEKKAQNPSVRLLSSNDFELELQRCISHTNRHGNALSLVVLEIDHIELLEEMHGQDVYTKLLSAIAHLMFEELRQEDVVGQLCEGEFAVLLPSTKQKMALSFAKRLHQKMTELQIQALDDLNISVGVTELIHGEKETQFVERVMRALFQAKDQGRNQICSG